jgi:hypothetical protein
MHGPVPRPNPGATIDGEASGFAAGGRLADLGVDSKKIESLLASFNASAIDHRKAVLDQNENGETRA